MAELCWNADNLTGSDEVIYRQRPVPAANFGGGELTEDGDAIEWTEIATAGLNLTPATNGRRRHQRWVLT